MKAGLGVQGTLPHVNWNQFGAPNTDVHTAIFGGLTLADQDIARKSRDAEFDKRLKETGTDRPERPSRPGPGQIMMFP
jgi:hypothetical protein